MLDTPLEEATFIVVDVETTGMDPVTDRITEIAMLRVRGSVLEDEFSTLVNPLVSIPATITRITGIDNLMVLDAPPAREIAPTVRAFLGDHIFTAHNASFDWGFVSQTLRRETGLVIANPQLCTVKLSRRILPQLPSKSLGVVAQHLEIRIPERHRASGDAYATAMVLIKYLSYVRRHLGLETVGDLMRYQERSPSAHREPSK